MGSKQTTYSPCCDRQEKKRDALPEYADLAVVTGCFFFIGRLGQDTSDAVQPVRLQMLDHLSCEPFKVSGSKWKTFE